MSAPRPIRQPPLSPTDVALIVVFGLLMLGWLAVLWFVVRAGWHLLGWMIWQP